MEKFTLDAWQVYRNAQEYARQLVEYRKLLDEQEEEENELYRVYEKLDEQTPLGADATALDKAYDSYEAARAKRKTLEYIVESIEDIMRFSGKLEDALRDVEDFKRALA